MIEYIKRIINKVYNQDAMTYLKYIITVTYADGTDEEKERLAKEIKTCLKEISVMSIYYRIYLMSALIVIESNPQNIVDALEQICISDELSKETKYYLLRQFDRIAFIRPEVWSDKASIYMRKLYDQVFSLYKKELSDLLVPIPKQERNPNFIVIFTTQFLGIRHAPTHSTFERCYCLGELMGKQVFLINTREVMTTLGEIPFFRAGKANLIKEYNSCNTVEYKGYIMDFFQPESPMPDVNVLRVILGIVREMKPWFVLGMGDYSITADLCSRMIPEAALSFGFSGLPATQGQMSILGRQLLDGELEQLMTKGYREEQIIESTFTFELHEQKKTLTKAELGLPDDKFILVSVGTRLHDDITDEFIERILNTVSWNTHFVLMGHMDNYNTMCEKYPELKECSTFLGYQDDVLAVLEHCDLYVNPRRIGGGFSIVEAFYKNVPGVTIAYGDIAAAAGRDFWVKDYDEMFETVRRYIEDKEFYKRQVENAKERLTLLLDGEYAMKTIIEKIEGNELFF